MAARVTKRKLKPRIPKLNLGRPTEYQPAHPKTVKSLCKLGATDSDIMETLGISMPTFYQWKHLYPEFARALVVAKKAADTRVKRSLYQRAVGFRHESVKVFFPKDAKTAGDAVLVPYAEYVIPDVTACIIWLKNRCPNEWRDRREHDVSGKVTLESLVTSAMDGRARPLPIAKASDVAAGPVIEGEVLAPDPREAKETQD